MRTLRSLMFVLRLICVAGIAFGLAVEFGLIGFPVSMMPVWDHIPSFGSEIMGRVGTLFVAAMAASAGCGFLERTRPVYYAYYR